VDSETDMNRQKWMHRLAKITTIVVSTTRTHIVSTFKAGYLAGQGASLLHN